MIFESLAISYLFASSVTFYIDFFYPQIRVDHRKEQSIGSCQGKAVQEYSKILPTAVFNLIITYPLFYLYESYLSWREQKNENPFYYNFICWLLLTDIFFYTVHRILHHPKLFCYHRLHHSYRYTYGPGAIYSSSVEFIFSNLLPNLLSFQILSLSRDETIIIIVFQTFYTVIVSHGGYLFNQEHLQHHLTFQEPYGLFISDYFVDILKRMPTEGKINF
jgi:sterol desaturase/sphingolipid hydroxylase (fatty acid hydroxylase superfamily)